MTIDQIHDAISANTEAKAFADAGKDIDCANVLMRDLPPDIKVGTYVVDRGVIASFSDPTVGEGFLTGLALAAQSDPIINRVLIWLSPSEGGVDVGNAVVRSQLDYLASLGIPGITTEVVNTLKGLAETPKLILPDEVSAAWLRNRPNGRIA